MNIWEIILFITSIIIMIVGMLGIIVPIIPSIPLIWIGAFFYAVFTGFDEITWKFLLLFALLTVFSIVIENIGNVYGAKKFGATKWGIAGSILGSVAGFFWAGAFGLILGPVIGTIIFEMIGGKNYIGALRSGLGNFVGFVGGTLMKGIIGVIMIGIFVWKVFD
ncbi:MAG: DUF456 domain-containing protein [Candidatus Kuenenia sp.]|nr:DUF456 domain-containing protein [Candidatus Kuenenia hertensis]